MIRIDSQQRLFARKVSFQRLAQRSFFSAKSPKAVDDEYSSGDVGWRAKDITSSTPPSPSLPFFPFPTVTSSSDELGDGDTTAAATSEDAISSSGKVPSR